MPCARRWRACSASASQLEAEVGIEADEDAGIGDAQAGAAGAIEVGEAALEVGARIVARRCP